MVKREPHNCDQRTTQATGLRLLALTAFLFVNVATLGRESSHRWSWGTKKMALNEISQKNIMKVSLTGKCYFPKREARGRTARYFISGRSQTNGDVSPLSWRVCRSILCPPHHDSLRRDTCWSLWCLCWGRAISICCLLSSFWRSLVQMASPPWVHLFCLQGFTYHFE